MDLDKIKQVIDLMNEDKLTALILMETQYIQQMRLMERLRMFTTLPMQ